MQSRPKRSQIRRVAKATGRSRQSEIAQDEAKRTHTQCAPIAPVSRQIGHGEIGLDDNALKILDFVADPVAVDAAFRGQKGDNAAGAGPASGTGRSERELLSDAIAMLADGRRGRCRMTLGLRNGGDRGGWMPLLRAPPGDGHGYAGQLGHDAPWRRSGVSVETPAEGGQMPPVCGQTSTGSAAASD